MGETNKKIQILKIRREKYAWLESNILQQLVDGHNQNDMKDSEEIILTRAENIL